MPPNYIGAFWIKKLYIVFVVLSESAYDVEFDHLLRGMEVIVTDKLASISGLNPQQVQNMVRLAKLPAFRNVDKLVQKNTVSVTLITLIIICQLYN